MVALGLALIYGVMRVINIAHGTILMLGAYTTFWWFHLLGVNPYLSLLASMPLMFLLGMLLQRMLVTRVVDAPELSSLLLTFGISIALVNVAQLSFTSDLRSVEFLTGAFLVGPIALSKSRLIAFAFALVITFLAFWFLQKTKLGKAIRATSQSSEVAMVCGINVPRVHLYAFGIASALAGAGALLGGMLLGLVEQLSSLFLTTQLSEAVAYVLLVLVLLLRPTGLLGGRAT
jgi:branched-chain amino acid transport system permease protein